MSLLNGKVYERIFILMYFDKQWQKAAYISM